MIKRPLAMYAVVFLLFLSFLSLTDHSIFGRNPVKTNADGSRQLADFLQDDPVRIYGILSDYSYHDRFSQTTTELILTDVHIELAAMEAENADMVRFKNNSDKIPQKKQISNWRKIARRGQNILVYINKEETLSIGERILLSGKLSFFEKAANPGQFDAEKYYEQKDTLFAVKKAVIEKRTGESHSLRRGLKNFAKRQEAKLDYFLEEKYAAILKAMLFGNKKALDEETKELYQDNGIAHVLAISGLHISLLGMAVYRLLRKLPLPSWTALFGSEIFLLLYGCMVGFSASAFRAIGMFTFFLISKMVKRSYDMITSVAFVAILQLMIHPGYLFDGGFQLSYAAILGMGVLLPALQKLTEEIPLLWLRKTVSYMLPSVSVTLLTAPVIIYHYHEISFFSILLNVIVLPFVGVLLFFGLAMLAIAPISISLALWCTLPIRGILAFYEYSCRVLECFPIGQKNIAHPSMGTIFIYYSLLIVMTVWVNRKRNLYQFLFPAAACILLFFPRTPDFSVWMLDVGQGDCNVIFDGQGHCFIIDCGSTTLNGVGEKRLIPFLKYYGVGRVDAVFLTHADADHTNGVLELLEKGEEENLEIGTVVLHENTLEQEPEKWEALLALTKERKIPIKGMQQGDLLHTDSLRLECLYPLKSPSGLRGNAASLVLRLESREVCFRALFAGDLEMEGEQLLLSEYEKESDADWQAYTLLKVGHHGSAGSSSTEFLEWVSPEYAGISCDKNSPYGHPHEETLQRLKNADAKIVLTSQNGAIKFGSDESRGMGL